MTYFTLSFFSYLNFHVLKHHCRQENFAELDLKKFIYTVFKDKGNKYYTFQVMKKSEPESNNKQPAELTQILASFDIRRYVIERARVDGVQRHKIVRFSPDNQG